MDKARLMKSQWKVFLDTKSDTSAERVARRVFDALGVSPNSKKVAKYHKGGHVLTFDLVIGYDSRAEAIVGVIQTGQKIAREWQIRGAIENGPSASSHRCEIPGVEYVSWVVLES